MPKDSTRPTSRREQRKERKEQEQQAALDAVKTAKKRKIFLFLIPIVTIAFAIGIFEAGLSYFLIGMVLLTGFFIWLGVGLGAIGTSVQARNRGGAGSINFGK
jgi:hypothetical protein